MLKIERLNHNRPILTPRTGIDWEVKGICNPGVAIYNNQIYLLYRAFDQSMQSSFGLATSSDGLNFTFSSDQPVFTKQSDAEYEKDGIENPRITFLEKKYNILYTSAARYNFPGQTPDHIWKTTVCHATTADFTKFTKEGILLNSGLDKDAALFPEKINGHYYLHHRSNELEIGLSRSTDLKNWELTKSSLIAKTKYNWENERVSIGTPPIKTSKGWLSFYHGRNTDGVYNISAFLADLANPSSIIGRLDYPLLQPELEYEKTGSFPNVVYTCGIAEIDDQIYVYYGCADYCIGVGKIGAHQLLQELIR